MDDAALIATELVTNAVRADSRHVALNLTVHRGTLLIEVIDDGDGWPTLTHPTLDTPGGRGLLLIIALSARWGAEHHQESHKRVWATVAIQDALTAGIICALPAA